MQSMTSSGDAAGTSPGRSGEYLTFTLAGEDYGVDILKVQEIRGWEVVRHLPDTPDYVKGVLDLRGTIVPVVDLRIRFRTGNVEYGPTTVIIVVAADQGGHRQVMGLVVDGVSDVLDVAGGALRDAPNLGTRVSTRFIRGMVTRDARMVVLLDVDRLLNPEELNLLEGLR